MRGLVVFLDGLGAQPQSDFFARWFPRPFPPFAARRPGQAIIEIQEDSPLQPRAELATSAYCGRSISNARRSRPRRAQIHHFAGTPGRSMEGFDHDGETENDQGWPQDHCGA